jgi:hypothetical protein
MSQKRRKEPFRATAQYTMLAAQEDGEAHPRN